MSGLIGDLYSSTRALGIHSQGLQVTGKNLANVNNPDHARQRIATESYAGPGGSTYERVQIEQVRDAILDRNIVAEAGSSGRLEGLERLYRELNSALGQNLSGATGSVLDTASVRTSGVSGAVTAFLNSWEALAATPSDPAAKAVVFQKAEDLAGLFNDIDADLTRIDENASRQLDQDLAEANQLLERISSLNEQVVRAEARRLGGAAELRDARQKAVEELGKHLDFDSAESPTGGLQLFLRNTNTSLVEGNEAATLSVIRDAQGSGVTLATTFRGNRVEFEATAGSLSVLQPSGAQAEVEGLRLQLDDLAAQVAGSVNTIYGQAADAPVFFHGSTAADLRLAVASPAAITAGDAAGAPGNNRVALEMASLSSANFSTATTPPARIDGTLGGFAISLATERAAALAGVSEKLEHQGLVNQMLRQERASVSGVSMDEEVTEMMRLQKAFQASARVVNTINSMLELVTTRLGS